MTATSVVVTRTPLRERHGGEYVCIGCGAQRNGREGVRWCPDCRNGAVAISPNAPLDWVAIARQASTTPTTEGGRVVERLLRLNRDATVRFYGTTSHAAAVRRSGTEYLAPYGSALAVVVDSPIVDVRGRVRWWSASIVAR